MERSAHLRSLVGEMERTGVITHSLTALTFDDYYRANRDSLTRALALSLGSVDLGIDATAEAMTRTFQNWKRVQRFGNPMGWTYRVGLNWGRSRRRKASFLFPRYPIAPSRPRIRRRIPVCPAW